MRTADERISLVLTKGKALQKRCETRMISELSGVSALCVVCLVAFMNSFADRGGASLSGFYGASLIFSEAGAYVLVGVIAFVLGAAITGLCLYVKHKNNINNNSEEDENK